MSWSDSSRVGRIRAFPAAHRAVVVGLRDELVFDHVGRTARDIVSHYHVVRTVDCAASSFAINYSLSWEFCADRSSRERGSLLAVRVTDPRTEVPSIGAWPLRSGSLRRPGQPGRRGPAYTVTSALRRPIVVYHLRPLSMGLVRARVSSVSSLAIVVEPHESAATGLSSPPDTGRACRRTDTRSPRHGRANPCCAAPPGARSASLPRRYRERFARGPVATMVAI